MRSTKVARDLSDARSRLSETVRTAMLTGRNRRVSSIPAIAFSQCRVAPAASDIDRHVALGNLVQAIGRLAKPQLIDPEIRQHALDKLAGLGLRQALDQPQRVPVSGRRGGYPARRLGGRQDQPA